MTAAERESAAATRADAAGTSGAPDNVYTPRVTLVHRSLLEVKTIAGVEDRLAILNATFALAIVMGSGLWPYLVIAVAIHVLAARATRDDPCLRRVYVQYLRQADRYDPWPSAAGGNGRRPRGFARRLLC